MRNKLWLYTGWSLAATISCISLIVVILYGITFGKVKSALWMTSFLIALIHKIIIADPVRISIIALWRIYKTRSPPPDYGFRKDLKQPRDQELYRIKRRLDYLMERFEHGKWESRHFLEQKQTTDMEETLLEYNVIFNELFMFTFYIIALLLIVVGSKDDLSYYSTRYVKDLFASGKNAGLPVNRIVTEPEMLDYIRKTILPKIHASNANETRNSNIAPTFIDGRSIKLLGVARIRQHRSKAAKSTQAKERRHFAFSLTDDENYNARWEPRLNFTYDKEYWRLWQPWTYVSTIESETMPVFGHSYLYPGGGYTANFGRSLHNSKHVLEYLLETNWIDNRTVVIFIEFTLYSANANLFNIVTIVAERSPFGSYSVRVNIKTAKLLFLFLTLPWLTWVAVAVFFVLVAVFIFRLILRIILKESVVQWLVWYYVDVVLVALSIATVSLLLVRNAYVVNLLNALETSRKNTFTSFYYAAVFDDFFTWISALLVCIATIRLWKILHFALVFRILTKSLYRSAASLASTIFLLAIFLIAISVALHIINGGNSIRFSTFQKTFGTLLAFTASLPGEINTMDVQYGGKCLGILLYALQEIVVCIFLLNMIVTIACFYLKELKADMAKSEKKKYTFWHFLQDEYRNWKAYLFNTSDSYQPQGRDSLRLRGGGGRLSSTFSQTTQEAGLSAEERSRRLRYTSEKTGLVNEIVTTQMDYLERYMDEHLRDINVEETDLTANASGQSSTDNEVYSQNSVMDLTNNASNCDLESADEIGSSKKSSKSKNYVKSIDFSIRNI